jgi:hypothetical protein
MKSRTGSIGWCFFSKTMANQKDKLAANVKEEQALRSSLPSLSRQMMVLADTSALYVCTAEKDLLRWFSIRIIRIVELT